VKAATEAQIPAFWFFWRQQGHQPSPDLASSVPKSANHVSSSTLIELSSWP